MAFSSGSWGLKQSPFSQVGGHPPHIATPNHTISRGASRFKPNSDDIRDSPALNVAAQMRLQGASVIVTDPQAVPNAQKAWPDLQYADSAAVAAKDIDLVLLLTEWDEYRNLDPVEFGSVVAGKRILDGRNALDPAQWRAAGWAYRALGRK